MSTEELLRLSVSKTKTYIDCSKKYKFSYVLKLPRKERDYLTYGKFIHQILEDYHRELLEGCKDRKHIIMGRVYKKALDEYGSKLTQEQKDEGFALVQKYLEKQAKDKKETGASVISVERNFELHITDSLTVIGMIDKIQYDADKVIHVIDYKTTKNKKYLKNDWFQLLTYCYVLLTEQPNLEEIRASYVLLRHDFEYITKTFKKDEILEIKSKYEDYAKTIRSDSVYDPNPTALCGWCDYLDQCEEGKKHIIKTGRDQNQSITGKISW